MLNPTRPNLFSGLRPELKDNPFGGAEILRGDAGNSRLDGGLSRLDGGLSRLDPRASRLDDPLRLDSDILPFGDLALGGREQEKTPKWLPAAEGVRNLSSARNIAEAMVALERLGQLAHSGDPHAKTALAATLVNLTTS